MFSWGKGTVFLSPEKVSFRALFGVNRMKGKKCCLIVSSPRHLHRGLSYNTERHHRYLPFAGRRGINPSRGVAGHYKGPFSARQPSPTQTEAI